jgi:hypothetical protein
MVLATTTKEQKMSNETTIALGTRDECGTCGSSIVRVSGRFYDKWSHETGQKFAGTVPIVDDMCPRGSWNIGGPSTYAKPKTR